MKQIGNEDFDCFLLRMEQEFNEVPERGENNGGEKDFGFGFRIRIPLDFLEADRKEAEDIFWSEERPPILFLTRDRRAGITFRRTEIDVVTDGCLEKVRQALRQADGRTVFYGSGAAGKEGDIPWLEYKSFASDERVYNLAFLFAAGRECIMGTFYCAFGDYDRWKPAVFEMLHTIKTAGE